MQSYLALEDKLNQSVGVAFYDPDEVDEDDDRDDDAWTRPAAYIASN